MLFGVQSQSQKLPEMAEGHRYWRAYVTESYTTDGFELALTEVQLREESGGPDVTGGGTGFVGSSGLNGGDELFDNNNSTQWVSENVGGLPEFFGYDFGAGVTKSIVEITIRNNGNTPARSPKAFYLQYSDDGASYTTLATFSDIPSWGGGETKVFQV